MMFGSVSSNGVGGIALVCEECRLHLFEIFFLNCRWNICNSIHLRLSGVGCTRIFIIIIKDSSQFL